MASSMFCSSINPSAAFLSRTQFPVPISKDYPIDFFQSKDIYRGKESGYARRMATVKASVAEATPVSTANGVDRSSAPAGKNLKILVAGGGIGGLVFALAAKRKGFQVMVFERDLSAIRGEGQYRGPIQIQSNALAALEAIDLDVAEEVMKAGCITGQRINGLVDGVSGTWYIKFDTFTPAAERGLPVTRVISRMTLQRILADAVGEDIIMNGSNVVSFEDDGGKVTVVLENGQRYEGDLLVGADGIRSKVRTNLFGLQEATYSGYTCYTGIADFVPPDIESVGYRVFLGHKQYFVSSDVGGGKMQWYAFHKEPAGGVDGPSGKKERLLHIFGGWCDNVIDLLLATNEDAILRRDIYDRPPSFNWGKGHVTLLGDSIHAMQPNLGQGGCMAIEDSYQLAMEVDKAWSQSIESGSPIDVISSLRSYESSRRLRVAVIHGLARMAAIMASTYKAYLGVGLGPLSFLTQFRIPHPGRVGGRFFIDIGMPLMLSWVLGGNDPAAQSLKDDHFNADCLTKYVARKYELGNTYPEIVCCSFAFGMTNTVKSEFSFLKELICEQLIKANNDLRRWFEDDDALERAINGEWFLLPYGNKEAASEPIFLSRDEKKPCIVGSVSHTSIPGISVVIPSGQVSKLHARINCKEGAFFLTDLRSEHGTWITDIEGKRYRVPPNFPARFRLSDVIEFGSDRKATFRVKVMKVPQKVEEKEEGNEVLQAV
ncbi:hypothetical protein RJ639_010309 [Escallonia herrerae]|uniref:Zeaxanthin epoxidase, chloroplastic n=1 Tax=Escallonia herrerae TaxID=1293975 RepID=A0AA88VXZ5_9ASTE|nr:hypothetical protein RJ639_010309 [Escallonia herrerae]